MKSIYNEYLIANSEDAQELYKEVSEFMRKIFKKYHDKGYSPREISHEIVREAVTREAILVLQHAFKTRKNNKTEKEIKSYVSNN